jgi:ACS family D-galactonate transporter-like MFS transporter
MATIQYYLEWKGLFIATGMAGFVWGLAWFILYRDPVKHKHIGFEELDYIKRGGGIIDHSITDDNNYLNNLKEVFFHRKLWGIYLGQFAINSSLWFFLTWFPIYLIKFRGLALIETGFLASIPFIAAFAGILLSGFLSDFCIRKNVSVTVARKMPVVIGLLLTVFIVGANYVESTALIILFMAIAFFGNGMASITWVLVSLLAPKGMIGVTGGAFNFVGNLASMSVPFIIGYLVRDGNFSSALIFISVLGIAGIASYIFLVGKIERVIVTPP